MRQFQSFSSSFGVVVKNLSDSIDLPDIGDFDAISVMGDGNLLYVECKSGATDAEQIVKAVRRGRLIGSAATVIALSGKTGNFSILKSLLSLQQHPELHHPTTVFDMTSINLPDSTATMEATYL